MRFTHTWVFTDMRRWLASIAGTLLTVGAPAADISDPTQFLFASDEHEKIIDVVALSSGATVHRIETSIHADHIVATPFAPILMYTETESRKVVFYSLRDQEEVKTIELPITPRNVVLDTTGAKIGISDNVGGGFVLLHAYKMDVEFVLPDFPATGDVLFDPNDVDVYFTNQSSGSIGMLDINTQRIFEMKLTDSTEDVLSPPSRSLDARYIYVSNVTSGKVYSLNAYSRVIFNSFDIGGRPARPYTTPQGAFLYMMDGEKGRFVSVEQRGFDKYADLHLGHGIDIVTVGRFDRMNLFTGSDSKRWSIVDNVKKEVVARGTFNGMPVNALGSADGRFAYVAFTDVPEIAVVDLEEMAVSYVPATENGSRGFTIGLSNNVCH